jgi:serine/threonine-protein kinase
LRRLAWPIELTVRATPPDAKLYLDDVPLSGNPSIGQFHRDGAKHAVRVDAPHYVSQTVSVSFDDRTRVVDVHLAPAPPPPPKTAPVGTP